MKWPSDVTCLFPVFFSKVRRNNSFMGKLAKKQLLSQVFSKVFFLYLADYLKVICQTEEKTANFFFCSKIFLKEIWFCFLKGFQ